MVGCLWTVYLPIHLKTWEQVGNSLRQKGGGVSFCILLENLKVHEFKISWKRRKNRVDKDTGQHH